MGLIGGFSNQTIGYRRYLGLSGGTAKHADPVQIKGRYEHGSGRRYTPQGTEIALEGYLLTEHTVTIQSLVNPPGTNQWVALRGVKEIVGKGGKVLGYEANT